MMEIIVLLQDTREGIGEREHMNGKFREEGNIPKSR